MDWTAGAVREAREQHGWTQQQLADRIDASLRSVVAWEAGKNPVSRRYQRALEKTFRDHDEQQSDRPEGPTLREATAIELAGELVRRLVEAEQLVSHPRVVRGPIPAEVLADPRTLLAHPAPDQDERVDGS